MVNYQPIAALVNQISVDTWDAPGFHLYGRAASGMSRTCARPGSRLIPKSTWRASTVEGW
jgi:hypothetical protein